MSAQETLTPGPPTAGGIWARYLTDGHINHAAWLRAHASGEFVGTCRTCGAHLMPASPDDRGGGRHDYEANCAGCGKPTLCPGGRYAKGSTRRSERRS